MMNIWYVLIFTGMVVATLGGAMGWVGRGGDAETGASGFKSISVNGPPWVVVLVTGVVLIAMASWRIDERDAAKDKEEVTDVPVTEPTQPPIDEVEDEFPNGFTFGDNQDLDRLWLECSYGIGASCDDLFLQSDTNSDYEYFGLTCGDTVDPDDLTSVLCEDIQG